MPRPKRGSTGCVVTERGTSPTLWLAGATVAFVLAGMPILYRGAPLADDFTNCLEPVNDGLASTLVASWERLGPVRPARFVEILLTTGVCQSLPFGFAIAVPLALSVAVAWLLRGLLTDMGAPRPWPEVAGVVWLLQPLGTEAALWPAALHVPLGLALALAALRLHLRGAHLGAGVLALASFLSLEQAILALPLAVWLIVPDRQRAAATSGALAVVVLAVYLMAPGADPRLQVSLADRVTAIIGDPLFLPGYAAVGTGVHSIPLAVVWALPLSGLLLLAGAGVGWWLAARGTPYKPADVLDAPGMRRAALGVLGLVAAANVPVLASIPLQGSPRVFAPTWLILAGAVGALGWRLPLRLPMTGRRLVAAGIGTAAVGAALSIALSVNVRLLSADAVEDAAHALAAATEDSATIAVCDVDRTVTSPAPRGAFATHELIYEWAAAAALEYYSGRQATFDLAGPLWDAPCPDPDDVNVHVGFDALISGRAP